MVTEIKTANAQTLGKRALQLLAKQKAVSAIVVILAIMWFSDSKFYTVANWINIFRASSINLIIAFGVTFAVICRGCDLSVGAVMSLSGILAIQLMNGGMNMWLAIVLAILSGSLIGFVNGFLVVHQKTEAFIITLGMGMLIKGVAQQLTDATPVYTTNMEFMKISNAKLLFDIPNVVFIMLALGILTFCLLRFTSFGRNCYALGGDYEVAKYSGINVVRTKWIAFVITGTMAAIAGVLLSSSLTTGSNIYGDEIPLLINCSVVIGGTSFAGGIGGILQSSLGIMVMGLLDNSLNMLRIEPLFTRVDPYVKQLIIGLIIVAIICLDCYTIKRKKMDV